MKNNVWVAISFSMLAAAATGSTAHAEVNQPSQNAEDNSSNTEKPSLLVKALKVDQKPTFENALPCYNRK